MPCNNDYNVDDLINSIQILSTVDSKNNYVILDFDFKIVFVNDNFRNFLDNVFYLKNNKIISQIKMDISQKRLKSYPVIIQSNIYILQISSLQNNLYLVNFSRYTTYNLHYKGAVKKYANSIKCKIYDVDYIVSDSRVVLYKIY